MWVISSLLPAPGVGDSLFLVTADDYVFDRQVRIQLDLDAVHEVRDHVDEASEYDMEFLELVRPTLNSLFASKQHHLGQELAEPIQAEFSSSLDIPVESVEIYVTHLKRFSA